MFLFVINERVVKVLCERTRSFGDALYKSPGIKVMHGRVTSDFFKPLLIIRIDSKSKTIHRTAMGYTMTSTQG